MEEPAVKEVLATEEVFNILGVKSEEKEISPATNTPFNYTA